MNDRDNEKWVMEEFKQLLTDYLNTNHSKNVELIERAFNLAYQAHKDGKRKSGEPYILHPIAVASICCNMMGLGSTSIAAALLHDVVEDTDYTVEDMRTLFGDTIAVIVDGLTKLSGEKLAQEVEKGASSAQVENITRTILKAQEDPRVLLIKIADRLHNMRTLSSMAERKQAKIVAETRLFYAQLAERLGMYHVKSELEDLTLLYDHPSDYYYIQTRINDTQGARKGLFQRFYGGIKEKLEATGLKYEIEHRVKSVYSIWKKMKERNLTFDEIYDLFAVRIIFEPQTPESESNDCFRLYQAIASVYRERSDRFRNWISYPKENGYQALHLTVMSPDGLWVEIQIRSHKMHDLAEQGLAAHWKYKQTPHLVDSVEEMIINNVRTLLSNPGSHATESYETMMYKFANEEILVFTKEGKQVKCNAGISVLDFAFLQDQELGLHCIGAKVNHQSVSIDHILKHSDQVEILSANKTFPKEEWISYAQTPQVKSMIREYLREDRRKKVEQGRKMLNDFVAEHCPDGLPTLDQRRPWLSYRNCDDLYFAIQAKEIELNDDLIRRICEEGETAVNGDEHSWSSDESEVPPFPSDKKLKDYTYTLEAHNGKRNYIRCPYCNPIFGEEVHGILNDKRQVVVHKRYCDEAIRQKASHGDNIVHVAWGAHYNSTFGITLELEGPDMDGFIFKLSSVLKNRRIPFSHIHFSGNKERALGEIIVRIHNLSELDDLFRHLRDELELLRIVRKERRTY